MNIFDKYIEEKNLFKDISVFHDYVPDHVPIGRENETEEVAMHTSPIFFEQNANNILLIGKKDTGKSTVLKYIQKKLEERATTRARKILTPFINASAYNSPNQILYGISKEIGFDLPKTGLSFREMCSRLDLKLGNRKGIFFIDHLDQIQGDSNFLLESNIFYDKRYVTATSDSETKSSFFDKVIEFESYRGEDIEDILKESVRIGLKEDSLEPDAFDSLVSLAQKDGLSYTMKIIEKSAMLATRQQNKISSSTVDQAIDKIKQDEIRDKLSKLTSQERLIISALKEVGYTTSRTGYLYEVYVKLAKNSGHKPLTDRRFRGLLSELDEDGIISTELYSRGRYGRSSIIKLNIPKKLLD